MLLPFMLCLRVGHTDHEDTIRAYWYNCFQTFEAYTDERGISPERMKEGQATHLLQVGNLRASVVVHSNASRGWVCATVTRELPRVQLHLRAQIPTPQLRSTV